MFSDIKINVVGFCHVETCKKRKTEVSSQHTGLLTFDKSCNTIINVKTSETQTDESFVTGNIDFKALHNCLEKGLKFLETE